MERIGMYSGIFDPPHMGHIRQAQYVRQALGFSRLLVIPQGENALEQLEMLRLCFDGGDGIEPCGASIEDHPEAVLCLDADGFAALGGGGEAVVLTCGKAVPMEAEGVRVLETPKLGISPADLKRMLAFDCAEPFLTPAVIAYIRKKTPDAPYRNLPMEQLEQVVVRLLNPNRVRHTLGCRDTAAQLARLWGADETDAARAGLLHDITKALGGSLQLTLCSQYGIMLDEFSHNNPKTLHALTGSLVAQRIFGENQAVVDAICSHTTGKGNMNTLEKIIYVADYMEPNRDFPGVERLRSLAYTDLDQALKLGLEMTLDMLRTQGREISPGSREALQWLQSIGV